MSNLKKLILAGILVAITVVCSGFYVPVGIAKCYPVQHAINLIAGVLLGPWYAMGAAFLSSLIRVLMGTGSLLAFPGSMIGAFCCGLLFERIGRLWVAYLGEVIGTGILGAIAAYPIAVLFMAKEAALFGFVIPFIVSTVGGTTLALPIVLALSKVKGFPLATKQVASRYYPKVENE